MRIILHSKGCERERKNYCMSKSVYLMQIWYEKWNNVAEKRDESLGSVLCILAGGIF